jgi:hypothetical protein
MFSSRTLRFANPLFRQGVLRFALFLALFAALAPTVSRALSEARTHSGELVEICTPNGPRWMALATTAQADPERTPDSVPVFDHCPFCLLASERIAPPPQTLIFEFALAEPDAAPAVTAVGFLVTHHPPLPPSRGPPSFF